MDSTVCSDTRAWELSHNVRLSSQWLWGCEVWRKLEDCPWKGRGLTALPECAVGLKLTCIPFSYVVAVTAQCQLMLCLHAS